MRPHSLPAGSHRFVGMARETAAMPPACKEGNNNKRSFTSIQMCHTHTRHTTHVTRHTSHVSHVISDVGQIDAAQAHEFASPAPSWAWDQYLGEHPQSLSSAKKVQRNPTAFHSFPMLSDD